MLRPLVIVCLGLAGALALPRPCLACSCATDDVREQLALAGVVFRGQVVEVEAPPRWQQFLPWNWDTPRRTTARVRVETVWKGPAKTEFLVEGGDGGPDCSVRLAKGVEYIVLGQRQSGETLTTSRCLGTISTDHLSDVAAVLAALGPGAPVAGSTPASSVSAGADGDRWPLLLAGAAGLAALAGGLARRHFRVPPRA